MSSRPTPAPMAWALLLARTLATVVVTLTCGLAMWSVLPQMAHCSPSVVMTGSMEPRLMPGDVVLSCPASALTVKPGQIILVTNPAMPSHLLVHRFLHYTASGDLITKGDANPHEDSTPVPPGFVRGLPRLRLPYIGLGIVWLNNHSWRQLGLAGLMLLVAFGLFTTGAADAGEETEDAADRDRDPEVAAEVVSAEVGPAPRPVRALPNRDPVTGRFTRADASR